MRNTFFIFLLIYISFNAVSQEQLPYATIPEQPTEYTAANVTARMIDGLGFRYYWATEGLNMENMETQGTAEARTIGETVRHIRDLSTGILSTVSEGKTLAYEDENQSFEAIRKQTLNNLFLSSMLLRTAITDEDLKEMKIVFKYGGSKSDFPFWNLINGQIEDAVWHAGQIVTLRRMVGNPINPKVNVFLGKLNE